MANSDDTFSHPDGAFADSEFRASNRKRLLKALFYEYNFQDKSTVLYSLKDEDHKGYPSLSRLYLEMMDPTEYNFAIQYFESWDHWEALCQCAWFKPYIAKWRRELEVKIKSVALAQIKKEAAGGKSAFTAAKYLLERGWEPKEGQGRTKGRPSKDDIKKAADELVQAHSEIDKDFARIMSRPN